jgi:hypothetical protein
MYQHHNQKRKENKGNPITLKTRIRSYINHTNKKMRRWKKKMKKRRRYQIR